MKIIHTSDWHLGARFRETDRSGEHEAFLGWLLGLMEDEKPDALVVSGDIFDVKAPSVAAQKLYYGFLAQAAEKRLCRKIVVIAGNHDSTGFLEAPARLLDPLGVCVSCRPADPVSGRHQTVVVDDGSGNAVLAVVAAPFMYDAELANWGAVQCPGESREERISMGWRTCFSAAIAQARAKAPGVPLVVAAHCALSGAITSDGESERCRTIGGVETFDPSALDGADYVALGHLHRNQCVEGRAGRMFYSGSPLKMSFGEADDSKYVNIVELDRPGGLPSVRKVMVPETVPFVRIEGAPGEVKRSLEELAGGGSVRRYVRIGLNGFDGEARTYWNEFRRIASAAGMLILEEEDMRPEPDSAGGLAEFVRKGIASVRPRDIAMRKLVSSPNHYSADTIKACMDMFDGVAAVAEAQKP